jgi:dipeptidyl aminopeptidase/acylaminoacyl peptidase
MKRIALAAPLLAILSPVLAALAGGGCMVIGFAGELENRPDTDRIILSSDGQRAAYVWTDRCLSLIPWPPAMPMDRLGELKTESVGWCNPDGSNHLVAVDVRSRLNGSFGNSRSIEGLTFAPDGGHLAVFLRNRITIINTASGALTTPPCPDGPFVGAGWSDDGHVVYITENDRQSEPGPEMRRSVYCQAIDGDRPIWQLSWPSWRGSYGVMEPVSTDGQHVLLVDGEELRCLNTKDGLVKPLTRFHLPKESRYSRGLFAGAVRWSFRWAGDGSRAAALAEDDTTGRLLQAAVVDCQTGHVQDLTEAFRCYLPDRWISLISWTADGLILVQAAEPNGWGIYLVRPEPWKVDRFQDHYTKELPHNTNGNHVVQPFQKDWLALGPGTQDAMMVAVDYAGKHEVPITKLPFVIASDGSRIAEVLGKGNIRVRLLAPPDGPAAEPVGDAERNERRE